MVEQSSMAPKLSFITITAPSQLESRHVKKQVRANASTFAWKTRRPHSTVQTEQGQKQCLEASCANQRATDSILRPDVNDQRVPAADLQYLGAGWSDPFFTYPVPFQPWMPWMLDYCEYNARPKKTPLCSAAPVPVAPWAYHNTVGP